MLCNLKTPLHNSEHRSMKLSFVQVTQTSFGACTADNPQVRVCSGSERSKPLKGQSFRRKDSHAGLDVGTPERFKQGKLTLHHAPFQLWLNFLYVFFLYVFFLHPRSTKSILSHQGNYSFTSTMRTHIQRTMCSGH